MAKFDSILGALRQADFNWVSAPISPTSAASRGDAAYESGWLYIAVAANTWERVALATWTAPVGGPLGISLGLSNL